jgi:lysophospholipase L1-like esterase
MASNFFQGVLSSVLFASTALSSVPNPPDVPPEAATFLPTLSTTPNAVFGTTRLVSAYSGPAVRVQRASDDAEQDIGFGTKYLDTTAAATFRGASSLGVKTLYDQSGGAFHQAQATKVNQPGLYANSLYNLAPAISFDSSTLAVDVRSKFMANVAGPTIAKENFTEFYLIVPSFSFNDNYYASHPADATTVSLFTKTTNVGLLGNNTSPYMDQRSGVKRPPPIIPHVLRYRGGSSGKQFGVNGNTYTVGTAPAAGNVTGLGFGRWNGSIPSSYDGEFDLLAYVCYPAALSDADCVLVETALKAQCGVVTNQTVKVVFDGDSRTEGSGSSKNRTWPKKLVGSISTPIYATNMGVGGQTLGQMSVGVAARVASQYDASFAKNIVVLGGPGINDFTGGASASTVQGYMQTYAAGLNAGQTLVVSTIPLRSTETVGPRAAYNTWLRANYASLKAGTVLVDLDAIPQFATYDTTYWIDIVHFNDAGQQLWADAFKPVLEALIAA